MQAIASSQTAPPNASPNLDARAGKYLVFSLGAEEFGTEVLKVREIMAMQDITAIPQVPPYIKGVINLRGKVIPVIDLRLKFDMEPQEFTLRTCIVVMRTRKAGEETLVGMIVDCVAEVLNLNSSDIEDAPDFGPGVVTPYLIGMAKIKGKVMSLFIVLWLLNTSPQIKKAVAGYFNDPRSSGKQTGTLTLGSGESVSIDKQNVDKLKEEIEKAILKQTDLTKLSKQIDITVTGEGLKIELIEDQGGTFFESGSPKLSPSGVELLNLLSTQLKALPNRLLIEGHTDAQPYSSDNGYTNWELSADRANAARRLLQQGGVGPDQISQVRGYADQMLRVPSNPLDPSNRRVSLIVQWADAAPPPLSPDQPDASATGTAAPSAPKPSDSPAPQTKSGTPPPPPSIATLKPPPPVPASAREQPWIARIKALIPARKK